MPCNCFRFKQFSVCHDKSSMKVGVDGVTLGAWADVAASENILDVGCGSGLISLMVAQRSRAAVTAIDIDAGSVQQSAENAAGSPWPDRIKVLQISMQQFAAESSELFDHILSNPPFFVNSLKNPSEKRALARHSDSLPYKDLILSAHKLLKDDGRFSLILPLKEGSDFIEIAGREGFFCSRKCVVYPNLVRPAKRVLIELRKVESNCVENEITIEKERGHYTETYKDLVRSFYLKLPD